MSQSQSFTVSYFYRPRLKDPATGREFRDKFFVAERAVSVPVVSQADAPLACRINFKDAGSAVWWTNNIRYAQGKLWTPHQFDEKVGAPLATPEQFQADLDDWIEGTPLAPEEGSINKGTLPGDFPKLEGFLTDKGWDESAIVETDDKDRMIGEVDSAAAELLLIESEDGVHLYRRTNPPYFEVSSIYYPDGHTERHVLVIYDHMDDPDFASPEFWWASQLQRARAGNVQQVRGCIEVLMPDLPFWAPTSPSWILPSRPEWLDCRMP